MQKKGSTIIHCRAFLNLTPAFAVEAPRQHTNFLYIRQRHSYSLVFLGRFGSVTSVRTKNYCKALVRARLACHLIFPALWPKLRAVVTNKASTSTALKALVLPTQKFQNSELPTQPNIMAYRHANAVF